MQTIRRFTGKHEFLSNFYKAPVKYEGLVYDYAENAFQAAKTLDVEQRRHFLQMTPNIAKTAGRNLALRPDWEEVKDQVMYDVIYAKFRDNNDMYRKLMATDNAGILEGNHWHDNYWGICYCARCESAAPKATNRLGLILMSVRAELRGDPTVPAWR